MQKRKYTHTDTTENSAWNTGFSHSVFFLIVSKMGGDAAEPWLGDVTTNSSVNKILFLRNTFLSKIRDGVLKNPVNLEEPCVLFGIGGADL